MPKPDGGKKANTTTEESLWDECDNQPANRRILIRTLALNFLAALRSCELPESRLKKAEKKLVDCIEEIFK